MLIEIEFSIQSAMFCNIALNIQKHWMLYEKPVYCTENQTLQHNELDIKSFVFYYTSPPQKQY